MPSRPDARYRGWCFTINNPSAADIVACQKNTKAQYVVYGEEVGENGTLHLQGFLYYKNPRPLSAVKKRLPRAHLEGSKAKDPAQAINYCKKGQQSHAEWEAQGVLGPTFGQGAKVHEAGVPPKSPKAGGVMEKERWAQIKKNAMEGKLEDIDPKVYVQHYRTLKQISVDHATRPPDLDQTSGIWLYGPSGCGKTTLARTGHGDNYFLKAPTKWWDSYDPNLHPLVILDDLDPYHKSLGYYVKMWADRWCFVAERKGSASFIRPKTFIITSQYLPESIWDDRQTVDAVRRRCRIIRFTNTPPAPPTLELLSYPADSHASTKPTVTPLALHQYLQDYGVPPKANHPPQDALPAQANPEASSSHQAQAP